MGWRVRRRGDAGPVKRSGFKRKTFTPAPKPERVVTLYRVDRPWNVATIGMDVIAAPRDSPVRSEPYRRLVAAMDCIHCGKVATLDYPSQAAHADEGKGLQIKSDDRTCFPLCVACHILIGASGAYTKHERRALEGDYGERTRGAIVASGRWPPGLPHWEDRAAA